MTRIKICGIRTIEHALAAADAGADAVGLVFYAGSARQVDVATARDIVRALPPFVTAVGLFVNETIANVRGISREVGLELVQLSGDETPEYAAALALPHFKALRVTDANALVESARGFSQVRGILLDAYVPGSYGGTGMTLDWNTLAQLDLGVPLVLAGGLNPGNVGEAIRTVKPWAVDVSSGVEVRRGEKDSDLIRAFVRTAKQASTQPAS
jgi:phosphoribosylanthranilate isomerase